jgi:hypothetical protein
MPPVLLLLVFQMGFNTFALASLTMRERWREGGERGGRDRWGKERARIKGFHRTRRNKQLIFDKSGKNMHWRQDSPSIVL